MILVLTLTGLAMTPLTAFAAPVTQAFSYTGGEQSFIVPAGVTSVRIAAVGGRGSASPDDPESVGGAGGAAAAAFAVAPGDVLSVTVAGDASTSCAAGDDRGCGGFGGGGDSDDGGGGGGASSVGTADGPLVVAGGGGGAGAGENCFTEPGGRAAGGNGGAAGEDAADAPACVVSETITLSGGGGGRGGSSGDDAGAGGTDIGEERCTKKSGRPGRPGKDGVGSVGGSSFAGGGGGGGGYFGGGSGGEGQECLAPEAESGAGGGGGGSSYLAPTGLDPVIAASDSTEANGFVTITYTPDTTAPALTVPANITVQASQAGGAVVAFTVTAIDDVDGPVNPDCSTAAGAVFPIGATTVSCTAVDAVGNVATGTFLVTVTPAALASLTVSPGSASLTAGAWQVVAVTGADAFGNLVSTPTVGLSIAPTQGGNAAGASCSGNACTATSAGTYTVTAAVGSITGTGTLAVTAGAASAAAATGGNNQSTNTGAAFGQPLTVLVTDAYGNPVANAPVTYTATTGSAAFPGAATSATVSTTAAGTATSPVLTAGQTAGPVTVTATTPGVGGVLVGTTFMGTVLKVGPARADLRVSIAAPSSLAVGASGSVKATVRNAGPQAAGPTLTGVYVPSRFTITNPGGGTARYGLVLFTAPTLASGQSITYTVTVKAGASKGRTGFVAGALSATADPNGYNNVAAAILTIT